MGNELKKWMPIFWGDYFRGTQEFTNATEHGAYLLLIAYCWHHDGKLPNDDNSRRRIAKCNNRQWQLVRDILMSKFDDEGRNERCSKELSYAIEKSKRLSANAKLRLSFGRAEADTPTPTPTPTKKERKKTPRADARRGAHLIPNEWLPTESHNNLASQLGLSMEQLDCAACEMRDWSKGGGKKRTDWDATFNNWLRRNAQKNYKANGKHEALPKTYREYRPPGWTDADEQKMMERHANQSKNTSRSTAKAESLLDEGAGVPEQKRH